MTSGMATHMDMVRCWITLLLDFLFTLGPSTATSIHLRTAITTDIPSIDVLYFIMKGFNILFVFINKNKKIFH